MSSTELLTASFSYWEPKTQYGNVDAVKGNSGFPCSTGSASEQTAQDVVATLWCQGPLATKPPKDPFWWAAPSQAVSSGSLQRVVPIQWQEFHLVPAKYHRAPVGPSLQPAEIFPNGSTALSCIGWSPQFGVTCKLDKCSVASSRSLVKTLNKTGPRRDHLLCTPSHHSSGSVQSFEQLNSIGPLPSMKTSRGSFQLKVFYDSSQIQQNPWCHHPGFSASFLNFRYDRNHYILNQALPKL